MLPSAVREKLHPMVDLDDPEVWAQKLQDRAEYFRKAMPMALENLAIAQHRDTLRYARIRSGAYRPQLRRFKVGDYVYLQREAPTTLDVKAGRTILRVKDILPSGVLLLECRDPPPSPSLTSTFTCVYERLTSLTEGVHDDG